MTLRRNAPGFFQRAQFFRNDTCNHPTTPDIAIAYDFLGRKSSISNGLATSVFDYAADLGINNETITFHIPDQSTFTRTLHRNARSLGRDAGWQLQKITTSPDVTVKTRLGWDDEHKNILEVAERLQDVGIQALTVHGRTRTQMYKGEADWRLIAEVKNNSRIHIPIFGNGDVDTPQKALEYKNRFGVDGIMIGRGAIGYPWIFNEIKHFFKTGEELPAPTIADRVAVCKKHLLRSIEWKNNVVGVLEMRRHYSHYFRGLPHFKDYRLKLVTMDDFNEIMILLDEIALHYSEVGVVN